MDEEDETALELVGLVTTSQDDKMVKVSRETETAAMTERKKFIVDF